RYYLMVAVLQIPVVLKGPQDILRSLEDLINENRGQMRHGRIPPLYHAGVHYEREPQGEENWQTAWGVIKSGSGDCEDLAAWRIAELREQGEMARPALKHSYVGWHVLVRRGNGTIEDPSRRLGM